MKKQANKEKTIGHNFTLNNSMIFDILKTHKIPYKLKPIVNKTIFKINK